MEANVQRINKTVGVRFRRWVVGKRHYFCPIRLCVSSNYIVHITLVKIKFKAIKQLTQESGENKNSAPNAITKQLELLGLVDPRSVKVNRLQIGQRINQMRSPQLHLMSLS